MVSIATVRENNSAITGLYGSGLVGVFVGGTSGIGESTARAFIRSTHASRAYLVGRDQARASRIIEELQQMHPDAQITFIKSDVFLLREVDEACRTIQQNEDKVNILFLSPGTGTMKGRDETAEGLDKKLSLHYYSRMRFVANLLPQLQKAGAATTADGNGPPLSRVVSVLEAGHEAALQLDDLPLQTHYSLRNCAKHATTMTSVAMEHLAAAYPQVSFVHSFPGLVRTRLDRDFGTVTKCALAAVMVLAKPWETPLGESGERHLFAATGLRFPARGLGQNGGREVAQGSDGDAGSGELMRQYRAGGVRERIWKHTLDVFAAVRGG
ncbi:short-chain dehydrogenase/reductase [Aspergillus aculeatinus CBS 121060]|uniref:Short-chain dehydrogenase/reductase n=1 Tax=Aspergillus aculeatinus CBS 121060 TaxID=1448322 RepID=A0ACD1H8L2_9EURO|nr:short-chain dehydrogenase/reductase [Aspergillus aculeatinus CBS 121060]RAH69908.1 short-chain dehydrogenase/reductase [Aspergillus aculeatinus CBS 121060]